MISYENESTESPLVRGNPTLNQPTSLFPPAPETHYWWTSYKDSNGNYTEVFKEVFFMLFNHPLEDLNRNISTAKEIHQRSNNNYDQFYWLRFWLERGLKIYSNKHKDIYHIPITEFGGTGFGKYGPATHAETRMAYDLYHSGRTTFFPTDIFMEPGDEIEILVETLDHPQTICSAATCHLYPYDIIKSVRLAENQSITYKASNSGTLMLSCVNNSHGMQSWGKTIEIKLKLKKTNKGKKVPLFIFGINSQKEWMINISQNPNPLNQIQIFNGLQRIYIPGDIIKRMTREVFINQLLAEYLLIGVAYDLFNGFDGSGPLHLPTQDLQIITYERCGYSEMDLVAVCNDIETRNSKTKFVDWHELGHQNTMGWSWGTEIEVVANLYELIAERLLKGKKNDWRLYDIYYYAPEYFNSQKHGTSQVWDPNSVINFLKTNINQPNFQYNLYGGYDEMSSTTYDERKSQLPKPQHINNEFLRLQMFYQLLFTYNDNFYAELGKAYREEWNFFEGWDTFNTNQKDKNWFVKTACDITKTNLLPFFDAWGLGISPEVRRRIEDQGYSFPV